MNQAVDSQSVDTGADDHCTGVEIAIVGMAGRFPDAPNIEALWRNVREGVESVASLSDDLLRERGIDAATLADSAYVKKGVVLEQIDHFDADFFGFSPREAERIDPQHRLFLETAWQALEHAGYGAGDGDDLTGIYAGSGPSLYLFQHLLPAIDLHDSDIATLLGLLNGCDNDSLVTRVAYKLDLRGPAVSVQTACSTSLAAVHLACRGLLNHEADLALAGGVWLNLLQRRGYRHQAGAILSPDGHCRAFDARAEGTTIGSGVGVVVLKRLEDARADGDTIHAVIKGSAMNNDGAAKVGYTAPSIEGQAAVILGAQTMAAVSADSIGYVEAHGTGTTLGDPIEIAALTQAFRASTDRTGYCALGTVKTNIGHLDAAAGVTGLIKTALALSHRTLPPSLNFETPNPQIDFANSPFYVNTEARPWPATTVPRRAGVSSFGMGGTNVHLVLEEAPLAGFDQAPDDVASVQRPLALLLSARSAAALDIACQELAQHLPQHPAQHLADIAFTLRRGRKRFEHRAVALVRNRSQAVQSLSQREPLGFCSGSVLSERPSVAFLFPGQGAQHVNMGRALYQSEPVFRATVDRCCELLRPHVGLDLRKVLFAAPADDAVSNEAAEATAAVKLAQTAITQPALFVIEYALAQFWLQQGIRPDAMLGHSIGEYVAACLAGVFTLEDALAIVAARGRLMQATQTGAMLAVRLSEAVLLACPLAGCDLAAVNGEGSCVLAGSVPAIESAERELAGRAVPTRRLDVSHAFHSAMVEPMLDEFRQRLTHIAFSAPRIPFISNVTGRWISAEQACNPDYWLRHVRATVRFGDGLDELLAKPDRILLEVGPGETLSALARRHPQTAARPVLASQCHPRRLADNPDQPARCLAQLWVAGVDVEKAELFAGTPGRRVPLPTYPFERQSYWVEPASTQAMNPTPKAAGGDANWLYVPVWKRSPRPVPDTEANTGMSARGCVLLLGDDGGENLAGTLAQALQTAGRTVVRVAQGAVFAQVGGHHFTVRVSAADDIERCLREVESNIGPVSDICHLWNTDPAAALSGDTVTERGFFSLLALAQVLGEARWSKHAKPTITVTVVASQLEDVTGAETVCADKATLLGPCKVMAQEYPHIRCRVIDVLPPRDVGALHPLARQIVAELDAASLEPVIALRGPHRWLKAFESAPHDTPSIQRLRSNGVYLITGGLGGIGLALARYLAQQWQARLVLLGRSTSPEKEAAVTDLQALGAEVLVLQVDVADATQMRAAVAATHRRFGALNGVVHAAGVAGGGMIAQRERAAIERIFAPKVQGTRSLMAAIADESPDFVVLCSSLASLVGGLGKVDYAAANAYLDAAAAAAVRTCDWHVVSINWDGWREVGMAAFAQLPSHLGISPEQGVSAFERIVNGPALPQVVVSTTDVNARLDIEATDLLSLVITEPVAVADKHCHPRPRLGVELVAPEGDLECDLAQIWREVLGITPLGRHDNLFELGGDSLLAIQLLARVRSFFGVDLHPAAFFQDPTIAVLAVLIETRLIEEIENA